MIQRFTFRITFNTTRLDSPDTYTDINLFIFVGRFQNEKCVVFFKSRKVLLYNK